MSWTDYAQPAALLVVAVGFVAIAARLGAASGAVPLVLGEVVIVLCVLDIVSRSHAPIGRRVAAWLNPAGLAEATEAERRNPKGRRQVAALCGVVGFVVGFVLVGAVPAVAAFGLLALRYGAAQRWWNSLLITALLAAMVWVLFAFLLRLTLFPGILLGGEWCCCHGAP